VSSRFTATAALLERRSRTILGAALLMTALPVVANAQAPAPEALPFILVTGSADVKVRPDRARVSFAVVTEGATAAEAASQNATMMTAVNAALRATGAAGLTIESWGYDLQPRYARMTSPDVAPRIVGYQATNNVRATVDDVSVVGKLIDAGITAGANRVTSLNFEARNTDAARADALRQAVQKARTEAETMASALGVPLGPALEVHGGANVPMPPPMPYMSDMRMSMEAAQVANTPIEAAEQTVTAQVTIKFRLGTR
jgi:uncharacterized protein YggE